MRTIVLVAVIAAMLAMVVPAMAADEVSTVALTPVVLQPFDAHGLYGDPLVGASLSLHVLPAKTVGQWAADNVTLEIPCVGESWSSLKAGIGGAVNLISKENIDLKAGICYAPQVRKPALVFGISFPVK